MKRQKTRCASCRYGFIAGGPSSGSSYRGCVYILHTGKRRGCPVEECDKYERRTRGKAALSAACGQQGEALGVGE